MKMRKVLLSCGVVLSLVAMSGCAAKSSDKQVGSGDVKDEVVKVVIGTQSMPNDEGIAKAEGYFEEEIGEDVEIEIINFDSGADVITAIASGSIDFALAGSCPATIAISNGYNVECIWIHDVLGSAESLVARSESGVKTVADLKGKIIATPFASTAHFSLLKALETEGITPSDVTLLDMQPDEIYASWDSGAIDAAYVWDPILSQLPDSNLLCTSGDLAEAGFMTSNVELVNAEFADNHPQIVEGYIRALNKSVSLYKDDKSVAVDVIAKALAIEKDSAQSQMEGSIWLAVDEQLQDSYFGTMDSRGDLVKNFSDTAQFLKDQDSIEEVPEFSVFEKAINSEFIEKVSGK